MQPHSFAAIYTFGPVTFHISTFTFQVSPSFRFQISDFNPPLLAAIYTVGPCVTNIHQHIHQTAVKVPPSDFRFSKPHFSLVLKCVLISEVNFSFQASTEIKLRVLNCEGSDFKFQASMEARSEIRSIRLQTSNFTLQLKCACRM